MKEQHQLPAIKTERLLLTLPHPDVAPRILAHVEENREHLARWSPSVPDGYYTLSFWQERLKVARDEFSQGHSMKLVLFRRENPEGQVLGVCNFTNIIRGVFQACYLGYHLDYRAEGQGLMYEALKAAIPYAFDNLRLHRIMANYMPVNERSGKLLQRLGFVVEGYARDYLLIAGRWQDHIMTSLTNSKLGSTDV